jgi:Fe-S-cluster containining protein
MTTPPDEPKLTTVPFRVRWQGRQLQARIPLPTVRVSPRAFLPLVQQLASAIVGLAEAAVRDHGREVSCRAGCGACCRQVVPVTETEARHLRDLIEGLPEPRRSAVRERFAAGKERLAAAGLLEAFRHPTDQTGRDENGLDYFRLGIACPFLEDESCSIHPDRPVACREYLVTSPPEHCSAPTADTIRQVVLPTRPMPAFAALDGPAPDGGTRWVPLLLAPEWADEHPEPEPTEPGTALFARFAAALNAQKFPDSQDPVLLGEEAMT